ncbi:MAG: lysostaphin resistance A-like protein [Saprospiraceae bacterium]
MDEPTPQTTTVSKTLPRYIQLFTIIAKLLGYFLAVVMLCSLLGMGTSLLAPSLNPEDLQLGRINDWRSMTFLYIGMTIGAIIVTWVFRTAVDRQAFETVGFQGGNILTQVLKGGAWAIGIQSIVFLILYVTGAISAEVGAFEWINLLGFLGFFLLISIHEEVIFRGYVTSLLAQNMHFIPALIVSSLIFAAVHIGNADFTWMGFGSIFLGGYLLGMLYLKYQNLYLPIGMHWFWNYYHGNILGFDVSGLDVPAVLSLQMNGADWWTGGEFGIEGSLLTVILLGIVSIFTTYKWSTELASYPNLSVLENE